ncbi:MAG: tetratricopeptide repeat-containing protein [Albidovulum sp.]|nr:tetratricopeptide repeat-containing protein [Albidovulum sp.]MDE0305621.1 tetratricopeptide repeat-containing protein [Albidovulum sp.]MDE0533657.1 tetratricopeptide repeat-containing protein [Albidovulum sp.]
MREALFSGWSRWDLVWERLQENANRAIRNDDKLAACARIVAASVLAAVAFSKNDPRAATSVANFAFAANSFGAAKFANWRYRAARNMWNGAGNALNDMKIKPRARSSVFHMRMEIKHRDAYRANMARRMKKFIDETGECLDCLIEKRSVTHRLYSRWRGEKPPLFDDTRKILGACLLLAATEED